HIVQFRIEDVGLNPDLEYYLSSPQRIDAMTPPPGAHIPRLTTSVKALLEMDSGKVAELYQKAADQGSAYAQYNLAWRYENGEGVPKDSGKATELYQEAANQGNADAQYNLAWRYEDGEGVPKDLGKAAQLYKKAADQGDADALFNLALLCENGKGVPK